LRQREPQAVEDVIVAGALVLQPERVADLADDGERRGTGHEARDHGLRDVARQVAELQHRDQDLNHPDHRAEQEHGLVCIEPRVRIEERERAEDHERQRAGGAVDQVRRRAQDGSDRAKDDRAEQAEAWVDARDQRVRDALRKRDRGHGQAGLDIGARMPERVRGDPAPDRRAHSRLERRYMHPRHVTLGSNACGIRVGASACRRCR
jgi:hypothetical protein